ncbi:glycosyl transferase family 2 (plasmid) [Methanohalobium evestigatum Z-7303]|uniref:Glycosyl transferase family 2 n=1 Tax=Methanohalobium evestigatum (strain ATCC BAA-1072 / DSM 3721 / NBRC 107634 / OCM 161 / Z-7303) TaxID=644295 RepID=D7EBX8_METEZ|nr:glycosyltransferase family 2 protein [Methanohalobium evestigatum]ADI75100.1 glycosyl transferase family 2 [Methanohalobium evestigatum Z-7303]
MDYPFVSIVVGTRNEEKYIAECINSLLNLNYPKDSFEILIVDGMSTDNTQNIVKNYPVNLLINEKINVASARNLGIKHSQGDLIAFTDGDCKVNNLWLKTLVYEIQNAPEDVACVGGPNLVIDNDPIFARVVGYVQETFLSSGGSAQCHSYSKKQYVQSIPNCNALYKKSIIRNVGFFDEYFKVGQDGDLNFRISKIGYRFLYIPEAKVWHHRRGNLKSFSKQMFKYGSWMAELFKKHRDLVRWYALIPPIAILFSLVSIISSIVNLNLLYIFICLLFTYIILILLTALKISFKMKSVYGLLTVIILPLQHLMYGLGMLSNIC